MEIKCEFKVNWTMLQGETSDTILETSSEEIQINQVDEEIRKSITFINKNKKQPIIVLRRTKFKCLDGDVEILHEDPVKIFCANSNGELININL